LPAFEESPGALQLIGGKLRTIREKANDLIEREAEGVQFDAIETETEDIKG